MHTYHLIELSGVALELADAELEDLEALDEFLQLGILVGLGVICDHKHVCHVYS